jgi:class 3 adenylate cyclase
VARAAPRTGSREGVARAAATEAGVSAGEDALTGAVSVAFLFSDLKDFTAFAEAEGDGAAAAVVDRLAEVAADVATRPVVERTADWQTWESLGQREIRGVSEALEVFRLVSPAC